MAKKITDLTAATTPLAGTELVEIVQSGTSKKVAVSSMTSGREILTSSRTYYVRTDGSDSNDGLANTSGGAFLTVQKAVDVVYGLDLTIYNVTIQLSDGTYAGTVVASGPFLGSGTVTVKGNSTTPTNVVLSTSGSISVTAKQGAVLTIKDLKITNSSSISLLGTQKGHINFSGIDFGAAGQQVRADDGGSITATGNYTISGGGTNHLISVGGVVRTQSKTVTISGTPTFSVFASGDYVGLILANGNTYSGSATGARYGATMNGVIYVGGGGANYFPGNSAGSTATGGQYA